jgi:hypothetical protein
MTSTIVYDDHLCKIEIVHNILLPRTFWVVLDGDDEGAQWAKDMTEAKETAEDMREAFIEEHGQFGVGA